MRFKHAKRDHVFILTEKGVQNIREIVRGGAETGQSIKGREDSVPLRWFNHGYVLEVPEP